MQHRKIPVLFMLAAVLAAGCADSSRDARLARIDGRIADGDLRTARIELLQLIDAKPDDAEARFALVKVLERLGRLDEALHEFDELTGRGVVSQELLETGARILLGRRALGEFRDRLENGPLAGLAEPAHTRYLGEALIGLGEFDAAYTLLSDAAARGIDAIELSEMRARVMLSRGETENAERLLTQIEAEHPEFAQAWLTHAQLNMLLGKLDAAGEAFAMAETRLDASRQFDLHMAALFGQFDAAMRRDDLEACAAVLGKINAVAGNTVLAAWPAARLNAKKGDTKLAIQQLNAVLEGWPNNAEAHTLLGSLYLADGMLGLAESHLREAMEIDPRANSARFNLLGLQLRQGSARDAEATLDELLGSTPNWVQGIVMHAVLEANDGRLESVASLADQLEPLLGSAARAFEAQGDVYVAIGHSPEAVDAYREAFGSGPSRNVALKIFKVRVRAELPEPALILDEWLAEHPDDHAVRGMLAQFHQESRSWEAAVEQYRILLDAMPENPGLLNNLAWASHEIGSADAVAYARRAYEIVPGNGAIADTLGWLMLQDGDLDGIPYIEQAAAAFPDSTEIRYHLAVARAREGRIGDALAELDRVLDDESSSEYQLAAETLASELR